MISSPASPASRNPIATSCTVVFHLASLVTGTLTRNAARYSRNPDTRISRHRITIAAHSVQPWMMSFRGQHQQAGCHQQLVGDRIEHPAERRMLVQDSRIIAIQIIGNPGGDEHGQRHPPQPQRPVHDGLRIDAADHHRDRGDPGIGQDIREGQRAFGRSPGCGRHVHPLYQYRQRIKVNRAAHMICRRRRLYNAIPASSPAGCGKTRKSCGRFRR